MLLKKFVLLLICASLLSLSASAQWYDISFKKHIRYPQVAMTAYKPLKHFPVTKLSVKRVNIPKLIINNDTDFDLEVF
jgi:hypothetical protein